jgi:4-hydroxy-tetrahydrodipicolinate synthase
LGRPISLLTGNDNFIFESFLLGCDGGLLGLGNVGLGLQIEMFEALRKGDIQKALGLRERIQILADAIFAPPVVDYRARIKEALVMMGVLKNAVVRPPLRPLGDSERRMIKEALIKAGVLMKPKER